MNIYNLTHNELEDKLKEAGLERYRADQIFNWLYNKRVFNFDLMSNLSKETRNWLKENFSLQLPIVIEEKKSRDGTIKLLIELSDREKIESVLIPENSNHTLCLSTQVGCRYGCKFCRTARIGFIRDLGTAEINAQLLIALSKGIKVRNLVFMGMGEPLDNFENLLRAISIITHPAGFNIAPSRITVSTAGLIPQIIEFNAYFPRVLLAISLNSAIQDKRASLMPVARKYPLTELIQALKNLHSPRHQRITFEYVVLKGINDSDEDARGILRLIHGLKAKVNLIPYNHCPELDFSSPSMEEIEAFRAKIARKGLTVTIRLSRGADCFGACGQLIAQYYPKSDD